MSIWDRFRLDGRRLFITGGSRGLGREMALAIAEAGADVTRSTRPKARCIRGSSTSRSRAQAASAARAKVEIGDAENAAMWLGPLEPDMFEPGFKGDTSSNTTKPATLETGLQVNVPLFVNTGDKLKIDTRTGSYVERVKG